MQYWPSDRSARYQCFVVDPLAEYNMPQYLLREFKVSRWNRTLFPLKLDPKKKKQQQRLVMKI